MVAELRGQGLADSTAIILSAKHGQSPIDPSTLTRIDDGPIIDAINAAWAKTHPGATLIAADPGDNAAGSRDDAFPLWLNDRSQAATDFVKQYLLSDTATGNTYNPRTRPPPGRRRTLQHSGLKAIYAGAGAARYFGVAVERSASPGHLGRRAARRGLHRQDGEDRRARRRRLRGPQRAAAGLRPGAHSPDQDDAGLGRPAGRRTIQIAPTILRLLGLDPRTLQAVQIEGTQVLPGCADRRSADAGRRRARARPTPRLSVLGPPALARAPALASGCASVSPLCSPMRPAAPDPSAPPRPGAAAVAGRDQPARPGRRQRGDRRPARRRRRLDRAPHRDPQPAHRRARMSGSTPTPPGPPVRALDARRRRPADVDLVLVATTTADELMPGAAPLVAARDRRRARRRL